MIAIIYFTSVAGYIVVSHPFATNSKDFSVYNSINATITPTDSKAFTLDKVTQGIITFIGDNGNFGIVATDHGKLSIFTLSEQGIGTAIDSDFRPRKCYADSATLNPTNINEAYILDVNTDGGICTLSIDAAGSITDGGLTISTASPAQLLFPPVVGVQLAIIVSLRGVVSLWDWSSHKSLLSVPAFDTVDRDDGLPDAVVAAATLTADGQYLLVLDNNAVTGSMRLSAMKVDWTQRTLVVAQVISNKKGSFNDPTAIIASPYNNAVLVSSAQGNALLRLSYNANAPDGTDPFELIGPIPITTTNVQLPNTMLALPGSDAWAGLVCVAELSGIRTVKFQADGSVLDYGLTNSGGKGGEDMSAIVGAIGVQPTVAR